jgi:N-acyl-D-amino-acid deacylase
VLFEETVEDRATFEDPAQAPAGITDVWVAGQAVVTEGKTTGARPGKVLARE